MNLLQLLTEHDPNALSGLRRILESKGLTEVKLEMHEFATIEIGEGTVMLHQSGLMMFGSGGEFIGRMRT